MKTSQIGNDSRESRKGAIAMLAAVVMIAVLGMVACALDIGWIEMTRTQLQSAADASALAAGTELLPGVGFGKALTPAQIVKAASPVAVDYASKNGNAERASTYLNETRDVKFGRAAYSNGCNCWQKTPSTSNPAYYNYVEVKPLRNQSGSSAGDGPAPLFFARIFGIANARLKATSTAAILQANGFRIPPGSTDTVDMIPFAVSKRTWEKMERAQAYYKTHPTVFANTTNPFASNYYGKIIDNGPGGTGEPLFGRSGGLFGAIRQEFYDTFTRTDAGVVSSGADGKLELDIIDWENFGDTLNFGTIHVGSNTHPANQINNQILNGISASDLAYYANNQIIASLASPITFHAHFDIFSIFQISAFNAIKGKCRALALYKSVAGTIDPIYTVDRFAAGSVVKVDGFIIFITGIRFQPCKLVENNALADKERPIDDNSTIFTPVTLIR